MKKISEKPSLACLNEIFRYEPETGKMFRKDSYLGLKAGRECGTEDHRGYKRLKFREKGKIFRFNLHQVAWALHYGSWAELYIDHINGDPRDNRIANLREVSPRQNTANSKVRVNSRSGVKGVRSRKGKWEVAIQIGTFDTLESAERAYKEAAGMIHGEYAVHFRP